MKTNAERRRSDESLAFISKFEVRSSKFGVRLNFMAAMASLLILTILAGCQPATPAAEQKTGIASTPLPKDRQPTADEAVASDPCSTRLHDIAGALLMYYALNKRFPDTLEELKLFADAGTELKLTCPVSNQPYVYLPAGLVAPGNSMKIVVWDPTPAHNGMRWCIIMQQAAPGAALKTDVNPIREKEFSAFVPPIQ